MPNAAEDMVATSAFDMGMDKPHVRFGFHDHLSACLDAYDQDGSGRTRWVASRRIPRESCPRGACDRLQGHGPAPHHGDTTDAGMVLAPSHVCVKWMVTSRYVLLRRAGSGASDQRSTGIRCGCPR